MQCCAKPEQVKESCCQVTPVEKSCCNCHEQPANQSDDKPVPLTVKCFKCIHDTTKPASDHPLDGHLDVIALLPFDLYGGMVANEVPVSSCLESSDPPRHLVLCVWRC
jgi:hypothetical protein